MLSNSSELVVNLVASKFATSNSGVKIFENKDRLRTGKTLLFLTQSSIPKK